MQKEFDWEEEVTKGELRAAIFDVMNLSLRYWELASGKTKIDLCETAVMHQSTLKKSSKASLHLQVANMSPYVPKCPLKAFLGCW